MVRGSNHTFLVCLLNSIAFVLAIYIPTLIDPLLPSRALVYSCQYPLGNWVLLFTGVVFMMTYWSSNRAGKPLNKAVYVGLSLILPALLILPNFDPFPHEWVLHTSLVFAFLVSAISFLHNHKVELGFVYDTAIDRQARIEKLKLEHESYYRLLVIFITGVTALTTVTLLAAVDRYESIYANPQVNISATEVMLVNTTSIVTGAFLFVLLLVLTKEIFHKINYISESFASIKAPTLPE